MRNVVSPLCQRMAGSLPVPGQETIPSRLYLHCWVILGKPTESDCRFLYAIAILVHQRVVLRSGNVPNHRYKNSEEGRHAHRRHADG